MQNFRIANTTLKILAHAGFNLYEIGKFVYRPEFEETPSDLEVIVEKVKKAITIYNTCKLFIHLLLLLLLFLFLFSTYVY